MGFNKIEKFKKNVNVFDCHQGSKLLKIWIFHENGLYSVIMFLWSTSGVSCHTLLERTVKTYKNGI